MSPEPPAGEPRNGPTTCGECGVTRHYPKEPHAPDCSKAREDVQHHRLRESLSGERMVHRLRDWEGGDTLYGAASVDLNQGGRSVSGKTYREGGEYGEDAEAKARGKYETPLLARGANVAVLYRATVRDPETEPRNPMDPGEPPLKFATLTEVEVLNYRAEDPDEGDD